MIVYVHWGRCPENQHPQKAKCNAQIPLSFVKNLSNGALKSLRETMSVNTIEDLYNATKDDIKYSIGSRRIIAEILNTKDLIVKRALMKKKVIKFRDLAMDKHIRITPDERQVLIAISLFKEILKDIELAVKHALKVNDKTVPFRQRDRRNRLFRISIRAISRAA